MRWFNIESAPKELPVLTDVGIATLMSFQKYSKLEGSHLLTRNIMRDDMMNACTNFKWILTDYHGAPLFTTPGTGEGARRVFVAPRRWMMLPFRHPSSLIDFNISPAYRHKRRKSAYTVVGEATFQCSSFDGIELDEESVIVYEGTDGRLWVRTKHEFMDGRFVPY